VKQYIQLVTMKKNVVINEAMTVLSFASKI